MNDYIKKDKRKKLKGYLLAIIVILLVFVIVLMGTYIYMQIDVYKEKNIADKQENNIEISKNIDEIKSKDEKVSGIIEKMNECVVGISKVKNVGNSIFSQNSVSKLGLGTGLIVSENGYILTNEHVSGSKYSTCYITLSNGKNYKGTVKWSNSDIDMAIIKINMKNLRYATLGDSDNIRVGESVYAIGNPIGFEFQRTVTSGIVSALNRTIKLEEGEQDVYMEDLIQTDATINPGNSGGPLLNISGEVLGINSVKITSAEGIGFAVPINTVKSVIESFTKTDKFEEASLGLFAYDKNVIPYINSSAKINTNEAQKMDLGDGYTTNIKIDETKQNGIYVVKVKDDSAAKKAGIREGDIIKSIDDVKLTRMCELRCYIYSKNPGDKVTLKIYRNNQEKQLKIKLAKKL